MAPTNSDKYVTWKAYWRVTLAAIAIIVPIAAILVVIGLAMASSHQNTHDTSNDNLKEHVSNAKQERKEISIKMDHVEDSVHKIEVEQAKMIQTLDLVYEEVLGLN